MKNILLNNMIICLDGIKKAEMYDDKIVIEYYNKSYTYVDYIDVKDNINEEKRVIEKDYDLLKSYLIEPENENELEELKNMIEDIKYILKMRIRKSEKIRLVGDLIDE